MSYFSEVKNTDYSGFYAECTPKGELRAVTPMRLLGGIFPGSNQDTNFSTVTNANGGTTVQGGGMLTMSTNTTANGSTILLTNDVARYIGGSANMLRAIVRFNNTGITNNIRTFGAENGTDGCYFKLSGTSLYACTMKAGVETAVISSSWNTNTTVPTLTVANTYEIIYINTKVYYYINKTLMHVADWASTTWTTTINLPIRMANINSGGATTNNEMYIRSITIYQLGDHKTNTIWKHITGAGTQVLKYSTGSLHAIVINNPGGTTDTLAMYDGITTGGAQIGIVAAGKYGSPNSLSYNAGMRFNNGFTIVTTGTTDYTIIYE